MDEELSYEESELRRTAVHEGGHAVIGHILGHEIGAITIRPGTVAAGCTESRPWRVRREDLEEVRTDLPVVLWPASVRERFERETIVYMAGISAELSLAWPKLGRQPRTAVERVQAIPKITAVEADRIAASTSDEANRGGDEYELGRIADLVHGDDLQSRNAWLLFMQAQTDFLISLHHRDIERMAGILLDQRTIGAVAVRQILESR